MKLECKNSDGTIRKHDYEFLDWKEVTDYIHMLFGIDKDGAIMMEIHYADGRKSASIRTKANKIIYQLKTIKDEQATTAAIRPDGNDAGSESAMGT